MDIEGKLSSTSLDSIEALRCILETEQHRTVDYLEARDVAEALLAFYKILGSKNSDDPDG